MGRESERAKSEREREARDPEKKKERKEEGGEEEGVAAVVFDIQISSGKLLRSNVKQFRGGLVFKARRLLCHTTLGQE